MPAIRTPSAHCGLKTSLASFLGFPSQCDGSPFIELFDSYSDDIFDAFSEFQATPFAATLPHCIPHPTMLPEFDDYESGSRGITLQTNLGNDRYNMSGDNSDNNGYDWASYDTSSSASGSPYLGIPSEGGFSFTPSTPTISITGSSPRSESGVLTPPSHEYSNGFSFSHCYSNDAPPQHCFDPYDRKLSLSRSRDPSPSSVELGEKVDRRRFPCLILGCERKFTSQYTLKVHMEAHKPKPKVTFQCTEGCSERFSRQHDRLRHEVAKHGKICEFSCDECHRFFSSRKTLGNHKCPITQGNTRWVNS
ncbi:hypothetical protein FA13DRAFT_1745281 [Coprinellus micaceus]|uniref:C2H2-type domain-containing protein n=1 Tax=Coprinellus micaceus TaxID=71717 RepID=A0A4Y7SAV8_COPMI|nr:hypothetical protein FA13DRAFT_1745281 [Coprinellus micaceus]